MKRGTINMRSAYFVLQCIYIHLNNRRPEFHFGRGRLFHVNFRSTKYSDMKMFAKNLPSNRLSRPLLHQREQWTRGQLGPIIILWCMCCGESYGILTQSITPKLPAYSCLSGRMVEFHTMS